MRRTLTGLIFASLALAGCSGDSGEGAPQAAFWSALEALCGQAYEGTLTDGSENARASFADQTLVMQVRHCEDGRIEVPFHVGEDRSRTWVFTRTSGGLRLKHDHRHEDGSEDEITQYGGDTTNAGSATVQTFPADQYSIDMFAAHAEASPGLVGAEYNVWTVELIPGDVFAYQLTRSHEPGSRFRVEFDLTEPVAPPPPAWGHD